MKKVIIAFAALLLGSVAANAESDFDGIYAGVQGGYGTYDAKSYGDDAAFSGGLFGGYGVTFGKVYVGGEANVDFNGYDFSKRGKEGEKEVSYGATGKLGYLVNDKTLGYGLVGWEHGEVKLKDGAESDKETADGLKFGAGVERIVHKNISARSELTYTDFGTIGDVDASEFKTTLGLAVRF